MLMTGTPRLRDEGLLSLSRNGRRYRMGRTDPGGGPFGPPLGSPRKLPQDPGTTVHRALDTAGTIRRIRAAG
ncbi:hypothetical protein GCM10020254_85280 [Streptomyces goshikiensis]